MKRAIALPMILMVLLLMCQSSTAQIKSQRPIVLDTIYANDQKNVALFFPEPVQRAIVGSDRFVFSYDRDRPQKLGLLQAGPGRPTNLLVLDTEGNIYSYILAYSKKVPRHTYFIDKGSRIGNTATGRSEGRGVTEKTKKKGNTARPVDTVGHAATSQHLMAYREPIGQLRQQKKISLKVTGSVYHKGNVYIRFRIRNRSEVDYEIDALQLYKTVQKKGRRASRQELPIRPIYGHNIPKAVAAGATETFVQVYPKFTLGPRERLRSVLIERNGSRTVRSRLR